MQVEWLFTHSSGEDTFAEFDQYLVHAGRKVLLFRVVRDPLANIEANYRCAYSVEIIPPPPLPLPPLP
jgi:hypothetical protein